MAAQKSNQTVPATQVPPAFRLLITRMEDEASSDESSFESPMIASTLKILEAENETEMWEADELLQTGGRDLTDVEQSILEYAVKFSANSAIRSVFRDTQGRGMYLLVRSARLDTGDEFVWNTSAPLLVGKILWLADHEKLPANVVIRGTDAGAGTVLKLKPIPRRTVRSDTVPVQDDLPENEPPF